VVLRVRMGMHTGEPIVGAGDYAGLAVHRAARICAAGHGGAGLVLPGDPGAAGGRAAFWDRAARSG
jgi:class 3 adenylate cyclase